MLPQPRASTKVRAGRLGLCALLCVAGLLVIGPACDTTLQSIAVTARQTSLAKGTGTQLTAMGTFSDGTTSDISSQATWSSADTAVATVGAGGLVQGVAPGQTSVSASYQGVTGSVGLTITAAVLTGVIVGPSVAAIALGTSTMFTAEGTFSDGTTQDLTNAVAWSADQGIAKLSGSQAGLTATGDAVGQTLVKATLMGQTGAGTLVVTSAALTGLIINPGTLSLAKGTTAQLSVTGTFSDSTTQDLTSLVTWKSGSTAVAVVASAPYGLLTAQGVGATQLTASLGAISAGAFCTVTAATLVSLAVTPPAPVLAQGTLAQLAATGTFSDGTTQDLTGTVTWTSSQTGVGTVSGDAATAGQVSAVLQGTTTLTAAVMGISGTAVLTVTDATLSSIAVTAVSTTPAKGTTTQLTATGTFSDATTQDLTSLVTWQSLPAGWAAISQHGVLSAVKAGPASVTATLGGVTSPGVNFNLGAQALVSIAVTAPTPQGIQVVTGGSVQLTATGTYSDGTTLPLTGAVVWAATPAGIAVPSSIVPGQVSGVGPGVATVTATQGGVVGTIAISVVVNVPTLVSLAITPSPATVLPGGTVGLTATGTYSDGSTEDLSSQVIWSSSSTSVATISNAAGTHGLATAVATTGSTLIEATLDDVPAPLITLIVGKRLFMTGSISGFSIGGVGGADGACQNSRPAGATSAKAVISDGANRIACKTSNCTDSGAAEHVNWVLAPSTTYVRTDLGLIGTTSALGLLNFPLSSDPITGASQWWSGFNSDWTSAGFNCSGWSSTSGGGLTGSTTSKTSSFLSTNTPACLSGWPVLCAEQ